MKRITAAILLIAVAASMLVYRQKFGDYASLKLLGFVIEVRPPTLPEFTTGADGQSLQVGDTLRTDPAGFGEVTYFDGSLTRLDKSTAMRVEELARAGGTRIRVHLDVGRTWNNVERLSGDDKFEVSTPVAVATVRGTIFIVSCTPEPVCTFIVLEGTVDVRTISGQTATLATSQQVVVGPDGTIGPATPAPAVASDPWFAANQRLDRGEAAFDEAEGPGNLAGTWEVTYTTRSFHNVHDESVGRTARRTWEITHRCRDGRCDADVTVRAAGDEPESHRTLRYLNGSFGFTGEFGSGECLDEDGTVRVRHGFDLSATIGLLPGPRAGDRVSALSGSQIVSGVVTLAGEHADCKPQSRHDMALTAVRVTG